jgi:integrase
MTRKTTKTSKPLKGQTANNLANATQYLRSRALASGSVIYYFAPSPKLRKAGFAGFDYLRLDANPMSAGEAIDAHAATLVMVARGAPSNAASNASASGSPSKAMITVDLLLDQWLHSLGVVTKRPKTIADYRTKANWIRKVYGDQPPQSLLDRDKLRHFHWIIRIAAGRAREQARLNVAALQNATANGKAFEIPDGRDALPMAAGVMRTLSAFASYLLDKDILKTNPITRAGGGASLRLATPEPRIRIVWPDQVAALMAQAESMGMYGIADFIALALSTGQRVGDVLELSHAQTEIRNGEKRLVLLSTKNKRIVDMPWSRRLTTRIEEIVTRRNSQAKQDETSAQPIPFISRDPSPGASGPSARSALKPYASYSLPVHVFDRDFRKVVNATAALDGMAHLATLNASDLRDTAITRMGDAGCTNAQICAISNHNPDTVVRILKHYMAQTATQADAAIALTEAYLDRYNIAY